MRSPQEAAVPDVAALPRIGGMATMPGRVHTFRQAVDTILPQVDRLFIFFDKFERVPADLVTDPKIVPLLASTHGNIGARGKFLALEIDAGPCLYFGVDDDIRYPATYVEALTRALCRHRLKAVVGYQANWFRPPHLSYLKDRTYLPFYGQSKFDCHADEIGTGTVAFYSANFRFDPRSWAYSDMLDLDLAIEAVKQGLPRIAVRRPLGFLKALAERQEDSIFARLARDDSRETAVMREAIAAYPQSWHLWEDM